MVYLQGTRLEVVPVRYLYAGGWLYGRATHTTIPGTDSEGPWPAAFEVEEVGSDSDWRTVMVHGGFYPLSDDGTEWERKERAAAIEYVRQLVPAAFTPEDPTPGLDVVFRIAVQEVTGRETLAGQ
jgi:nitroimidazol reductase NimA-like FMN-containing flavoprotein (pyridoxamine 5'-phosphate oxidase superfamily)